MPAVDTCSVNVDPFARALCEAAHHGQQVASFASDPLGAIAKACAQATGWVWTELAKAINATTRVDFTNTGFLREYALVFAASSVLVVILWLLAVGKRVVRGVGAAQAVGESIGFLLLAVVASAFAPAALVLLMGLVDAATAGLAAGIGADATRFLTGADTALIGMLQASGAAGVVTAGPVVVIAGSVVGLLVGLVVWVELLLAAAALYVAAVFGPLVFAGLVDRGMWSHTKKWLSVVIGLALVKPVLVIVLGLAAALAATGSPTDGFSSVLTAIALLLLSVFASFAVYRLVPVVGEELGQLHGARKAAQSAGPAGVIPGPAAIASQGMSAHMMRRPGGGGGGGGGAGASSSPPAAPVVSSAHRTSWPPPTSPPAANAPPAPARRLDPAEPDF